MKQEISVLDIGILGDMDATAIAEHIKKKEFTAQEVLDCVQARAEKANPSINAIVASDYQVRDYDENGVFAGVPMYIKDLINVKGFANRNGSAALPDKIEKKDEKVVPQILSTGCYVVGKSATSEFGLLPTVETYVNGDTHNPIKLGYSTGGSSGGAAALVASGVVPIAHTMDGGGSTRIPACCCGLIGLKPSRGRHQGSSTKGLPLDIVTHGIVSRTVRDTANYYHAIEQYAKHPSLPEIGKVTGPSKKRLKIAVFTQSPVGIESHPDVSDVVLKSGQLCEELGHEVAYIPNPYSERFGVDFLAFYAKLAWALTNLGVFLNGGSFKRKQLEPFTRGLAKYAKRLRSFAPGGTMRLRRFTKSYNEITEKYDVLLGPTLALPVPKLGYLGVDVPIVAAIMRLNSYTNFTIVQNATGAPAISLPM